MKRMLGILKLLLIAGKVNDLLFVCCQEFSGQMYLARWILIVYPVAGLAELLAGIDRRRPPVPAIALVDGAALRADRWIHGLQSSLIGIVNALMDEAVATLWLLGNISLAHASSSNGQNTNRITIRAFFAVYDQPASTRISAFHNDLRQQPGDLARQACSLRRIDGGRYVLVGARCLLSHAAHRGGSDG